MDRFLDTTAPKLLVSRSQDEPSEIALRDKHLGVYKGYSWSDYREIVEEVALGLLTLDVKPGDRVCVMGDPCVEWLFADLATTSIRGITVGVYPTSSPVDVEHVISDSGATIFFAETQEHLDKLLAVIDRLPAIRKIIAIDTRALFLFEHALLCSFDDLLRLGREQRAATPNAFLDLVADTKPEDPAAIVYTSGTTGPPKGAVLTHRNLLGGAATYIVCQPEIRHIPHRAVAHLPLSHVVARTLFVTTPLATKLVPFFCEEIEAFTETLHEVAPNFLLMPPRFYEKFAGQLIVGIQASSPLKQFAFRLSERIGKHLLGLRREGRRVPPHVVFAFWVARQLVFRQLLEKVGFSNVRRAFTGSAPMPPLVVDTWQAWGIDLREAYGTTEASGLVVAQLDPYPAPTDIGSPVPLPGFEITISAEKELLVRSPVVFSGYWQNEKATAEVLDAEGYYHTGDIVEQLAGNRIKLVDRMKDVFMTLGGKTLSPQQIEKVMKGSPFISEAVVFGDGRRYITALFELDFTLASEWARTNNIPYTSYTDLVTSPQVKNLIEGEVSRANKFVSRVEQVKRFRIIPVELDPEKGETTATRKIKRGHMYEMFKDLVEAMYEASDIPEPQD